MEWFCRFFAATATKSLIPLRPGSDQPRRNWTTCSEAMATHRSSSRDEPQAMHELMAAALDTVIADIRRIKADAREYSSFTERPRWLMIVLRTPKGWTCLRRDRQPAHRGLLARISADGRDAREHAAHVRILKEWMRKLPAHGTIRRQRPPPDRSRRSRPANAHYACSANPHTAGGLLLHELRLPNFRDYAMDVPAPGAVTAEATACGQAPARCHEAEHGCTKFPAVQSRREQFKSLAGCTRGHQP